MNGTVRSASGAPAAGSIVKLSCEEQPSLSRQTISDANGTYRVPGIAPCRYQVSAYLRQLVSAPVSLIVPVNSEKEMQVDINLGSAPPSSVDTPPRPTFAASGIRGLIDPGGYSAPANAAAASGLLSGMADVNRKGTSGSNNCAARALPALRSAYEAQPGDAVRALDLAEALVSAQQFDEARTLMLKMPETLGTSPAELRSMRVLARVDEGTGAFEAAAREYHQLAAIEHSAEDSFAEGYELILAGKLDAAATLYRDDLRLYPKSSALMIGAGTVEFLENNPASAIDFLLQATEAAPYDPRPYPFLAAASGVSGAGGEDVLAAMKRHLALVPKDAEAHLALAMELIHMPAQQSAATPGTSDAERELRQALSNDPALAEAHFQLAALLSDRGANDEAIRELELTVRLDPARKEAHYRLALALRRAGQTEAAAQEMQRFQQARAEDAAVGSDVRRYLSVMKEPGVESVDCSRK